MVFKYLVHILAGSPPPAICTTVGGGGFELLKPLGIENGCKCKSERLCLVLIGGLSVLNVLRRVLIALNVLEILPMSTGIRFFLSTFRTLGTKTVL